MTADRSPAEWRKYLAMTDEERRAAAPPVEVEKGLQPPYPCHAGYVHKTREDAVACGPAHFRWNVPPSPARPAGLREALIACLRDFDQDPPDAFVDQWLPRFAALLASDSEGLDVPRLARALHKTYPPLRGFDECEHDGRYEGKHECEYDAEVIAAEYARLSDREAGA